MKIAIHPTKSSFDQQWIPYCKENGIPFKIVDCYADDIMQQLQDCDALMWHINHASPKDMVMAKPLLYALQQTGKIVFPDFNTAWHFDDKLGQKYLLEGLNVPLVPVHIFYEKQKALDWAATTSFPKVFKLRGGAGSANVKLAHTKEAGIRFIKQAFGNGFKAYNGWENLQERLRLFKKGKTDSKNVLRGIVRLAYPPAYSKVAGKENGYAYFQDFIPGNDHDIRVVVIDEKAFAIKRMVRDNDFRASGSGNILYDKILFSEDLIRLTFDIAAKVESQCFAVDYVFDNGKPLVVEFSYGFTQKGYDDCPGYWDKDLKWHEGSFNPQAWMVDDLIKKIQAKTVDEKSDGQ